MTELHSFRLSARCVEANALFSIDISNGAEKDTRDLFAKFAAYVKSATTGKGKLPGLEVFVEPIEAAKPEDKPEDKPESAKAKPAEVKALTKAKPADKAVAEPATPEASKDDRPPRVHQGLSPSSLQLFMSCPRKYFLKKVEKVDNDSDATEDNEAFQVGKAFHKVLEETKHELKGFPLSSIKQIVCEEYGLTEESHLPLIFAMLAKYKRAHDRSGLKAVACEHILDLPDFYGIVDVVLTDKEGNWWIGDMKTSASYNPSLVPSLPSHPQLNLYAHYAGEIANALLLDLDKFSGCRYLLTTKSKLVRREGETFESFVARLSTAIKSLDFAIPKSLLTPEPAIKSRDWAVNAIKSEDESSYPPNLGGCMAYFRPCEVWSHCHGGRLFTDQASLEAISVVDADGTA